jgi:hypothetical protein
LSIGLFLHNSFAQQCLPTTMMTTTCIPIPSSQPLNPPTSTGVTVSFAAPPLGSNNPVVGSVHNLNNPDLYTVGILVSPDDSIWWDKTHDYPNAAPIPVNIGIPINTNGLFTITGWASDPHDLVAPYMRVLVVTKDFNWKWPQYQVEGIPWPTNYFNQNTVIACTEIDRNTGTSSDCSPGGRVVPPPPVAPSPASTPMPTSAPPASGLPTGASISFTAPAIGTTDPIIGTIQNYGSVSPVLAVYLSCQSIIWGAKPDGVHVYPVNTDGTFTITNWASPNTNDAQCESITILALIPGSAGVPVLGAPALPAPVVGSALASAIQTRPGAPSPAPVPSQGVFPPPNSIPWPPANAGVRTNCQNGQIHFAGYTFGCKSGGPQGPGNNIFSTDNIWTDAYGLHLTYELRNGIWEASEVQMSNPLGYGTYVVSYVGTIDDNDPLITWSPFFLWDFGGNSANGFREIDVEHARYDEKYK